VSSLEGEGVEPKEIEELIGDMDTFGGSEKR
jgi:hypothetical protein